MAAASQIPSRAIRILLLDDDPAVSQLMSALLVRAGYTVDTRKDGEEGWAALNVRQYDLLMTDSDMPRLNGLALVKRLRNSGISLPVIIVSGSEEARAVADDDTLRVDAVMRKPFNPDDLIAQVKLSCIECAMTTARSAN